MITAGFLGCTRMGGIASAMTRLAMTLRHAGFNVTVLFTTPHCTNSTWEDQEARLRGQGITFVQLPIGAASFSLGATVYVRDLPRSTWSSE